MKLNIGNAAVLTIALAASAGAPCPVSAQTPNLAGQWVLNRDASQFPPGIGFTPDWFTRGSGGASAPGGGGGGGRGGRRSGSGGGSRGYIPSFESDDDTKRVRQLTADARNPSVHLTIAETVDSTTITDDSGAALTFYADGRHEELQLGGLSVGATARRLADHLEVVYEVERDRTLRYTYSRSTPNRIVVDVQFIEHGKAGDHATRVYEMAGADATPATTTSNGSNPDAAASAASKSHAASEPAGH